MGKIIQDHRNNLQYYNNIWEMNVSSASDDVFKWNRYLNNGLTSLFSFCYFIKYFIFLFYHNSSETETKQQPTITFHVDLLWIASVSNTLSGNHQHYHHFYKPVLYESRCSDNLSV
jgi:hypothetical protein